MTANLSCSPAIHAAIIADVYGFARQPYVGLRTAPTEPADVLEVRRCALCGDELVRPLGIVARLARAILGDDIPMIARCRRALDGDEGAVQSYRNSIEMEMLMARGVRKPAVAGGPEHQRGIR